MSFSVLGSFPYQATFSHQGKITPYGMKTNERSLGIYFARLPGQIIRIVTNREKNDGFE